MYRDIYCCREPTSVSPDPNSGPNNEWTNYQNQYDELERIGDKEITPSMIIGFYSSDYHRWCYFNNTPIFFYN